MAGTGPGGAGEGVGGKARAEIANNMCFKAGGALPYIGYIGMCCCEG